MKLRTILVAGAAEPPPVFQRFLEQHGCRTTVTKGGAGALQAVQTGTGFDLALLDLNLENPGAPELLQRITAKNRLTLVVGLTDERSLLLGPDLIQRGAFDLVTLSCSQEVLEALLLKAEGTRVLLAENHYYRALAVKAEEMIGRSQPMQDLFRLQEKLVSSGQPILIAGERGTGKNLLVRSLHRRSRRGPFIRVDCRQHPDQSLELELWGAAGTTPPAWNRPACMELAQGGTLCLDEVSGMNAAVQTRLVDLLAGPASGLSEARLQLLCTTACDLAAQAQAGAFNAQLYQRFALIRLPPLRERDGDVLLLAEYFLRDYTSTFGLPALRLAPDARAALVHWHWPGNVRELKHCIERAALCGESGLVTAKSLGLPQPQSAREPVLSENAPVQDRLPQSAGTPHPRQVAFTVGQPLDEIEREMILRTVALTRGNRTKAAQILGISVRTVYTKLLAHEQAEAAVGVDASARSSDEST